MALILGAGVEEICDTLDSYQSDIVTLQQEMDEHRRALTAFKEELKAVHWLSALY